MKNRISINLEVSLVEIIFSILIFSIAGAIMLYCFGAARFTQIKANDVVESGSIIQSSAEMIKSFETTGDMNDYLTHNFEYSAFSEGENVFTNYYDRDWNLCGEKNKEYTVTVKISDASLGSGNLKRVQLIAEKAVKYPFIDRNNTVNNTVIYEINTKKFFPTDRERW